MLRDYQVDAVNNCIRWIDDYEGPGIAILPTAAGKSFIVAALASHYGKALVLQPSKELLEQNYSKYLLYNNNAAIFSASLNKKQIGPVTFATLGSIVGLPHLFKDVDLIICDEAHMYPTENSMFARFKKSLKNAKVIGLTATPFRLEREMMGSKLKMLASKRYDWHGYAHVMQVSEVKNWWSEIEYDVQDVDDDMNDILELNSIGSEYTEESVIEFAKTTSVLIEDNIKRYADRQTLVFVPSINQAENFAAKFGGEAVSSLTKKKDRKRIIDGFKKGEIMRIFNVDVLGVGFDHPALSVLIDANATLSLARYYQRIGRLTRPHENKKTYVDLAGNSSRFGQIEDLVFKMSSNTHKKSLHCYSNNAKLTDVYLHELHKQKEFVMPVGKYEGTKLSAIPTDYLQWVARTSSDSRIRNRVTRELAERW